MSGAVQVWLIMLRFFGGLMVVLTIILLNAALLVSSLVCFSLAGKLGNAGKPGEVSLQPPSVVPACRTCTFRIRMR